MIEITLDGVVQSAEEGERIVTLLNRLGVETPQICYQPSLGALRTCDTCYVEVGGALVRACATTLEHADRVVTNSERVRNAREEGMSRILANHELYCTVCDNNNGDCIVHNTFAEMDMDHTPYEHATKPYSIDSSHPFYRYDPDQCILCGRCVEACQNFQVNETLSIDWSLDRPRVIWDDDVPAGSSSCVGCGHCVTVCPCNALMEKSMLGRAGLLTAIPDAVKNPLISITKAIEPATGLRNILALSEAEATVRSSQIAITKTVCTYCGVGCSFDVWTKGREILKVDPTGEGPANAISTCVKGKFGWEFVNSPKRLTSPLIRRGDHFEACSWEEAFEFAGERMREIRSTYGADALAFISSSKCTNEESYLMQKLARAVVGTNNIDNCSRYCQSPATMGLWRTVGYGGDTGGISEISKAGLVITVGTNTAESHPVIAARVKRAGKLFGQRLIVADIRRHEMAERAEIFLRPTPGTDIVWISAVTRYIIENNMADDRFIEENVEGFSELRSSLDRFTLEFAERMCGIPSETLVNVAHAIHESDGVCILWAMGVTQHNGGSDTSTAISNLLLVTGNYRRPGAGAYPLRGHNNVQGASDFGSMPAMFPGYQDVNDPEIRSSFESAWGVELPTSKGLDNHEMVDAIHAGTLRSLFIIGEEMSLVDSNALHVQAAFEKLDLFIVQDIFLSETARFADLVLPASPSLEKDGTFTNTERRIQRIYQALEPLADSRPDWMILQGVANALGAGWKYCHPSQVMDEASTVVPIFAGVTYERLEGYGSLQWPVHADGTDTPLLYLDGFTFPGNKARFRPIEFIEPSEAPDSEFDLHLNNGRLLEHFHEGNMTYESAGLMMMVPGTFVEVSPELAHERGISNGSTLRLTSRRGSIRAAALISDRVRGNELYMPMNSQENESAVNVLTSSATDRATHTPAYKELAVRIQVLKERGTTPLPKGNHRNAMRNPTAGVQVEEKWSRPDYVEPPAPRRKGGL